MNLKIMFKSILVLHFMILILTSLSYAQGGYVREDYFEEEPKKLHIGIGTGINSFTGILGAYLEYNVSGPITLYAGGGLGSWGYKLGLGGRYYIDYPQRWAFNVGFSNAFGLDNFETDMETLSSGPNGKETVILDLHSASTLNFSALHFFKMGRNSRFNIEFGYAAPLSNQPYTIKNNVRLSQTSANAMTILRPGGIILAFGFSFGI